MVVTYFLMFLAVLRYHRRKPHAFHWFGNIDQHIVYHSMEQLKLKRNSLNTSDGKRTTIKDFSCMSVCIGYFFVHANKVTGFCTWNRLSQVKNHRLISFDPIFTKANSITSQSFPSFSLLYFVFAIIKTRKSVWRTIKMSQFPFNQSK